MRTAGEIAGSAKQARLIHTDHTEANEPGVAFLLNPQRGSTNRNRLLQLGLSHLACERVQPRSRRKTTTVLPLANLRALETAASLVVRLIDVSASGPIGDQGALESRRLKPRHRCNQLDSPKPRKSANP